MITSYMAGQGDSQGSGQSSKENGWGLHPTAGVTRICMKNHLTLRDTQRWLDEVEP